MGDLGLPWKSSCLSARLRELGVMAPVSNLKNLIGTPSSSCVTVEGRHEGEGEAAEPGFEALEA